MDDFLNSQIACTKQNTSYCLSTDCWFNHKDLGVLLDKIEKIGQVELEVYILGTLSPASTLEDIYDEITRDRKIWGLRFKDTYHLIKNFQVCRDWRAMRNKFEEGILMNKTDKEKLMKAYKKIQEEKFEFMRLLWARN